MRNNKTMSLRPTTIKILVAGGSFGGKSFLNSFISKLDNNQISNVHFEITLADPRNGFINILAIPKSISDPIFATTTYSTDLELPFDQDNDQYSLKFIHGTLTNLNPTNADITLIDNDTITNDKINVPFDYCIVATGRSRPWPFDPKGYTKEQYINEMTESYNKINASEIITIVGAGAVGIETAAELKSTFPDKKIILIHPHDKLPPELLDIEFKDKIADKLEKVGVDLKLKTRLLKETTQGFITTDNQFIRSDLILWCGSKRNNISALENEHFHNCIDHSTNEVYINDKLQIIESYTDSESPFNNPNTTTTNTKNKFKPIVKFLNIFAIGDITKFPVIKLAGGARLQLDIVSQNLFNHYHRLSTRATTTTTTTTTTSEAGSEQQPVEEKDDDVRLVPWSNGMLMSVGPDYLISNRDGITEVNSEIGVKCYKDYCNGFVSTYYKVKFDGVTKWE